MWHLADVAERRGGGGGGVVARGLDERDAAVLVGELVGAVDAAVAGGAERGLVGAAEHGGRLGAADVAAHQHGCAGGDQGSGEEEIDRARLAARGGEAG